MDKRKCGKSPLELPVLGAGCWAFGGGEYWGEQNQGDANAVVGRAIDLGCNYFDTAEAYNDGESERSLGLALRGKRDKAIVGTKVSPSNVKPHVLREHCEQSLRRLATDYIDIYMVHWPIKPHSIRHFTDDAEIINNPPPVEEVFDTLTKLRDEGKIRYIGVSNFGAERLGEALGGGAEIAVNELPYSLLTRAIESSILPFCEESRIGVIGYMTLLQGLLADIYPTLGDVPSWQRRTRHFNHESCELCRHAEQGAEDQTNQALADIRKLAAQCNLSMPQLAVKWSIANKAITCALVGARNVGELEENIKAASEPLDEKIVQQLNAATKPLMEKLGPSFDYYESTEDDRTC